MNQGHQFRIIYIKEYLKVEISGKCPISGKGYPLEDAHIIPYSESLNHHDHNILRISKEEHTKVDTGVIPRQVLLDVKKQLIDKVCSQIRLESTKSPSFHTPPNPNHLFVDPIR